MIESVIAVAMYATVVCNNDNIREYPCNAPVSGFEQRGNEWVGVLESGITFTSRSVIQNDFGRMVGFYMQDAKWYVTEKGIIYASSDLEALSIYLSQ